VTGSDTMTSSGSNCVCAEGVMSNDLECMPLALAMHHFSNRSWLGQGGGESPRDVGTTWKELGQHQDQGDDDAASSTTSTPSIVSSGDSEWDREKQKDYEKASFRDARDTSNDDASSRSLLVASILCLMALCVCKRLRYIQGMRGSQSSEAMRSEEQDQHDLDANDLDPAPAARSTWMRGLFWRHARQVALRRTLAAGTHPYPYTSIHIHIGTHPYLRCNLQGRISAGK
jgi:hypothetical protein